MPTIWTILQEAAPALALAYTSAIIGAVGGFVLAAMFRSGGHRCPTCTADLEENGQ